MGMVLKHKVEVGKTMKSFHHILDRADRIVGVMVGNL